MEDEIVLQELERLAEDFNVEVRYAAIDRKGGLCRFGGRSCVIVNRTLSVRERVRLIILALARFPLDEVYIRPQVRRVIEQECASSSGGDGRTGARRSASGPALSPLIPDALIYAREK